MKPGVLLHIGRHKTGTTALQNFFYQNRECLNREFGIYYPLSSLRRYAHHELGEAFAESTITNEPALSSTMDGPVVQSVLAEIEGCNAQRILISSESFQNADPAHVRTLFAGFDVTVIVDLRNHVEYLPSAYAQRIHATTQTSTLLRYAMGHLRALNFDRFLRRWARAFPDRLSVGLYDSGQTSEKDIRLEFLHRQLDLRQIDTLEQFDTTTAIQNQSTSAAITAYKWRINHLLPDTFPERQDLYFLLMTLSQEPDWNQRLRLSRRKAQVLSLLYSRSNRKVADEYLGGEAIIPRHSIETAPSKMPALSAETHRAIHARVLKEIPTLAGYSLNRAVDLGSPW